jgi:hypothetical protein
MTLATPDWYRSIARFLCPEGWPENYLVVDIETNGLGPTALPLQIAWLSVVDRKPNPEGSGTLLLDWSREGYGYPAAELGRTIEATRETMASRGKPYHLSLGRLQREGVDPGEGLAQLDLAMVDSIALHRQPIVGFNHCFFDMPIIDRVMKPLGGPNFKPFPRNVLLDLGLMEKARLHRPRLEPIEGEEIGTWYRYVADARLRGQWNLDMARQIYSLDCDPAKAHDAGADCFDTHLLLEAMRRLME